MPLFKQEKTLDELEEEQERTGAEVTLAQKKLQLQLLNDRLKPHGLTMKSFGGSIKAAIGWLKTH
jgi:hypothetical protein